MGFTCIACFLVSNFTGLLLVCIATLLGVWLLRRHFIEHQFFKKHGIDGPKPDILFGNYLQLKRDRVHRFSEWIAKYGDHFGMYNGAEPVIVCSHLDTIKDILVKEASSFLDRPEGAMNEEPFRSSILYLKGEKWKSVRSTLTPSFSAAKMRLMKELIDECVTIFVDIVKEKAATGKTFDMNHVAQGLTLDIIARCALAMDTDCQRNEGGLRKNTEEFFDQAENGVVDLAVAFPFLRPVLGFLYRSFGTGGIIKAILDNLEYVIKLRRAGQVPKQPDILQLMLDAQENTGKINDQELMANAFIFLVAGFETSATTLAFLTQILVSKPEIQEKIVAEVEKHFPGKTELSYEDLHSLKFLQSVIDECLRVYPPVVLFVSRHCSQDITLNGRFFPKGCSVMVPVYHIHHSPEHWDAPEEFRPERFAAEAERLLHPAQFLAFGLGPRTCIGMRFALLGIKMALVQMLTQVRLEPGDGFSHTPELRVPTVIINPKYGVPCKAKLVY